MLPYHSLLGLGLLLVVRSPVAAQVAPHAGRDPQVQAILRVEDQETGAAIPGAVVWSYVDYGGCDVDVEPLPETVTDEQGIARIDVACLEALGALEFSCVEVRVCVHHAGYSTNRTSVCPQRISPEVDGDDELVGQLLLKRGRSLHGSVVDPAGQPVNGAWVTMGVWNELKEEFDVELASDSHLGFSNGVGRVSFGLVEPEGSRSDLSELTAYAWHPRIGVGKCRVSPHESEPFTLRLQPSEHRLRGRFVCAAGNASGPLRFDLQSRSASPTPHGATSPPAFLDSNGAFDLHVPVQGEWALRIDRVSEDSYTLQSKLALIDEAVTLTLTRAWAIVRMVDDGGRPLRVRTPQLCPVERSGGSARPDWSRDSDELGVPLRWLHQLGSSLGEALGGGLFAFELKGPGAYGVHEYRSISGGHCWLGESLFVLERTTTIARVDLALLPTPHCGELQISVLDRDGAPVESFHGVVASAMSGVPLQQVTQSGVRAPEGVGGSFSPPLELPEGRYHLLVVVPDRIPKELEFDVRAGRSNAIVVRVDG